MGVDLKEDAARRLVLTAPCPRPPEGRALDGDGQRLAKLSRLDQFSRLGKAGDEAQYLSDHQLHARVLRGGDHPVAVGYAQRHRLLAEDVLPSRGGGKHHLAMGGVRRRCQHGIEILAREQIGIGGVDLPAQLRGRLRGLLGYGIRDAHEEHILACLRRPCQRHAHAAGPNETQFQYCHLMLLLPCAAWIEWAREYGAAPAAAVCPDPESRRPALLSFRERTAFTGGLPGASKNLNASGAASPY